MSGEPGDPGMAPADIAAAVAQARLGLRIDGSADDSLLGELAASAASMCEAFTGRILVARAFEDVLPASPAWARLTRTPVRTIAGVDALGADGAATALAPQDHAVDIDASGDGWVRTGHGAGGRVRVRYEAGLAAGWPAAPDALRQGVVRLAGHLYAHGAEAGTSPPASVAALWRPFRRMRLAGARAANSAGSARR